MPDRPLPTGKAEEKRAKIVAEQAAREAAVREARAASGETTPARKPRSNWAASPPFRGPRPGRPRKPGP